MRKNFAITLSVLASLLGGTAAGLPAEQRKPTNPQECGIDNQAALDEFTEPATIDGGPLWITLLNNRSIEALWGADDARNSLQTEASKAGTAFHVMGLATKATTVDTAVVLTQDGRSTKGAVVNMANLNGVQAREGSPLLGLYEFPDKVDTTKPFTLEIGGTKIAYAIDPALAGACGTISAP